jgi:hypothetical protein
MTIACPQCDASLTLKGLKEGTYTPKCPKCGKPFIISLVEDEDGELVIEQLEAMNPEPKPLPPTVAVPMLKRRETTDQPPHEDDEGDDITDVEEEATEEPESKPLPKTQPYPMVKKNQPPKDEDE